MKAESLIRMFDSSYRFRWELYDAILARLTGRKAKWLDAGCGMNLAVEEFPGRLKIGMDTCIHPSLKKSPDVYFVQGSLEYIPFLDNVFSLVTLNTVVEHLEKPETVFQEIHRILAQEGYLLIHTTNIRSPLIFLGKILPQRIRRFLFTRTFGALEDDVFRTFHRINTAQALKSITGFEVVEFHAVQDINRHNKIVLISFLLYHLLSLLPGFWRLRTNFIVLLRKK
jgi:ubiquinone/menaquinone biosynthesis C-methylase UbiE